MVRVYGRGKRLVVLKLAEIDMRYFLKLATQDGWFEEVDEYTCKNASNALNEAGDGPRYTSDLIIVKDGEITVKLHNVPLRDLAILTRALDAVEPPKVMGGFIREQPNSLMFKNGKMRSNGKMWKAA